MPRGGKREGAGRKRGSVTRKKTRDVVEKHVLSGKVAPLEVLLTAMERSFKQEDYETAARYAEKAAPYCHARLSSVEHKKPPIDLSKLSDDELQFLDELYRRAGASAAPVDTDGDAPSAGIAGPGGTGTRH
jgi:hypothetical protein